MKLVVIGAGGIGGYFGARLATAGAEVVFVARGAHLRALRETGLFVDSVSGDFRVHPVTATDDPGEIGPADAVLLCVKTWQLPQAIPMLPTLVGPGTAVVTTQNGVDAPDQVAAAVGRDAVLPGLAKIFSSVAAPGRISHVGGPASLAFGEWDNRRTDRVSDLKALLRGAGVDASVPADIWAELWAKMLFVVPFGTLGAASGVPIGALRSRPGTRQALVEAMGEIEAIARARGIGLPSGIVEKTLTFVDQQPAGATSSLQRDLLAGRPSELEAWAGSVVRLGRESGVATPVHGLLYELLAARAGQSPAG